MNRVAHSLVGYDRLSERVAEECDVPDAVLPRVKAPAGVPAEDADAMMCYGLDSTAARDLAAILDATINPDRCDYFLEGFAGDDLAGGEAAVAAPARTLRHAEE